MFKYLQPFRTLQAYNNTTEYRTDLSLFAYISLSMKKEKKNV
jgi:hypothetical protein